MRTFILIVLMVMLPMRAWSADRMAVQMASGQFDVALLGEGSVNAAQLPCHDGAIALSTESLVPSVSSEGGGQQSCQSCQLCMAIATPRVCAFNAAFFNRPGAPSPVNKSFVSATLAPTLKPPIF